MEPTPSPPRNMVLCFDGTSAEPEVSYTNVARLFSMLEHSERQLTYYDPGVGTLGSSAAVTRLGRRLTQIAGVLGGHGIRQNIAEAYVYLSHHYQPGDRIYLFGLSRGAYTARALSGLLHTLGLLRPGADNLVPYALKLYTRNPPQSATNEDSTAYWTAVERFRTMFSQPQFPLPHLDQIHFMGLWDTVKSLGPLNVKERFKEVRWPYTSTITNVAHARHALALDECRRFFTPLRFSSRLTPDDGDFQEVWFRGVHSDIGGGRNGDDGYRLPDIPLAWMVQEAHAQGLRINQRECEGLLGIGPTEPIPSTWANHEFTPNHWAWTLLGGTKKRKERVGDNRHPLAQSTLHMAQNASST